MIFINYFNEFIANRMLWNALLAWFIAQFIKLVLDFMATGKLDLHLIVESGGMPSSHSSTICAIAVSIGKAQGFDSPIFALAMVMAMIVMYDATGVRRATGEQGKVLMKLVDMMKLKDQFKTPLKEVLGHKPLEVLAGALLGVAVGMFL